MTLKQKTKIDIAEIVNNRCNRQKNQIKTILLGEVS